MRILVVLCLVCLTGGSYAQSRFDKVDEWLAANVKEMGGRTILVVGEWVMDKSVSSPGLFGSFPWVNNDKKYGAFLLCYYLKSQGRHERYVALKQLVDEAVQ